MPCPDTRDTITLPDGTELAVGEVADGEVLTRDGDEVVGSTPGGGSSAPTGTIVMFAKASSIPSGWLACDGSAVSRATYSTLFALVGNLWGDGDHSTTFNLPDMQLRVPRGPGTVGSYGGADSHDHAGASGSNTTGISVTVPTSNDRQPGAAPRGAQGAATVTDPGHTHSIASADNIPAYATVQFIIKT